ncbi:MAG: hypothetical protein ACRED8_12125 [Caulobacteraceae bacterium]
MPKKTPAAHRRGGPGAAHENRDKPPPDQTVKDPDDPDHLDRRSKVSGGGGEADLHHRHKIPRRSDA